jgi:hypothetical protein
MGEIEVATDPHITTGDALTRSLAESVTRRYPGRFDKRQVEAIRRAIEPVVNQLSVLRQYRLTNADEPEPIFRAYHGEG